MDIVFELLFDLLFEGSVEITKNHKISKWIRYPLLVILSIFFSSIIGLLYYIGFSIGRENYILSLIFVISASLMVMGIFSQYHKYKNNKKKWCKYILIALMRISVE